MLSLSKPLWDLPTPLPLASPPWRFLSVAVFSAAVCGGGLVKAIKNYGLRITVYGLLIFLALYGNRNHLRINDVRDYDLNFLQTYSGVASGWNEHLPIWIKETPDKFPASPVEILSGNCQFKQLVHKSNFQQYDFACSQDSRIQLNTAYYPGWQVKIDGQTTAVTPADNGMMVVSMPSGSHQLLLKFSDTALRLIAKIISLMTLALIVTYYSFHRLDNIKKIFRRHMGVKR